MKKWVLLLFSIFLASCTSSYTAVKAPADNSLNLLPRQRMPEVFYPGYRMPKEAYFEMGIFEYELPVSLGPPENKLPTELQKRNLDAAIVLDRRRTYSVNNNEYETLTCMGILYQKNVEDVRWVDRVEVELYEDGKLQDTTVLYFSSNGQFTRYEGSYALKTMAQLIQPWYFLQQAGGDWSEKPSHGKLPHRRLKLSSTWLNWKNVSQDDRLIYRISFSDFKSTDIYLEEIGNELVTVKVVEDDLAEEVENIFLIDKLKKQIWHRTGTNQRLVYNYHYTNLQEQNIFPLVRPQDLEQ